MVVPWKLHVQHSRLEFMEGTHGGQAILPPWHFLRYSLSFNRKEIELHNKEPKNKFSYNKEETEINLVQKTFYKPFTRKAKNNKNLFIFYSEYNSRYKIYHIYVT